MKFVYVYVFTLSLRLSLIFLNMQMVEFVYVYVFTLSLRLSLIFLNMQMVEFRILDEKTVPKWRFFCGKLCYFFLSFRYSCVQVCLLMPCGHMLGKG